jgi:hypothetical protein
VNDQVDLLTLYGPQVLAAIVLVGLAVVILMFYWLFENTPKKPPAKPSDPDPGQYPPRHPPW